jgi:putative peptide zinc metalloprotease protein
VGAAPAGAAPAHAPGPPPRLAEGVELIGVYEGSGFKEPPHIARRGDGQVIQLTELLFLVAEAVDGRRDEAAIAEAVTERYGRAVNAENVEFLIGEKLRPLGVLADADGSSPQRKKASPLLALRMRREVVPEATVQRVARLFAPLFWPPVLVGVLAALLAFDAWLFLSHGVAGGLRHALYDPLLLLAMFGAIILATAFHEVGHASACRYGGARPGGMGMGVYIVWPAFYCDVTDAYRLGKGGRLRTDLGGIYFNGIFVLLCGAAYFLTGLEPLLLLAAMQHMIIVQQLLPLLRFDGYYVLSDLTGVPDILARIKPILRSLLPGREPDERVTELKSWVRTVVTVYVVLLVPVLALMFSWLIIGAPRMLATAYDSGVRLVDEMSGDDPARMALGAVQLLALALPCLGLAVTSYRTTRMAGSGLFRWASGSTTRTALASVAAAAVVGFAAWTLWPNGDYTPIRPGERGTVGEAISALPAAASGRPTVSREVREAGDGPREPERREDRPDRAATPEPTATATPESAATPDPVATATPEPELTAEPTATATATPEPTVTATPTATATP